MVRIDLARLSTTHDITELDKGTTPFSDKLRTAFSILSLDGEARPTLHDDREHRSEGSDFCVRDELIFRWILNSQQAAGDSGSSARLDPRSWHLMFSLIQKVPVAASAVMLGSRNFLNILNTTLSELLNPRSIFSRVEQLGHEQGCNDRQAAVCAGEESSNSQVSESSATVIASPHLAPVSNPRKRKRKCSAPDFQSLAEPPSRPLDISNLLLAVLQVVESILALATTSSTDIDHEKGVDQCSQTHMRSVLRGNLDLTTSILGSWLRILRKVTTTWDRDSDVWTRWGDGACLTPIIEVWRSPSFEFNEDNENRVKAFADHCAIPALLLLYESKVNAKYANKNLGHIQLLETLLAQYLLEPARAAFFNERTPFSTVHGKEMGHDKLLSLSDLLVPLQHGMFKPHHLEGPSPPKIATEVDILFATPLLFDIAMKCSLQCGVKRRRTDGPWIDHVLITLAGFVERVQSHHVELVPANADSGPLERMLEAAMTNGVSIGSKALQLILVQFACLPHGAVQEVRWNLLDKISRIDADVFLPSQDGQGINLEWENNEMGLLDLLFTQITNVSSPAFMEGSDGRYNLVLAIVLRLLQAFGKARSLDGFITAWQKQVEMTERARTNLLVGDVRKEFTFSLWEDEDLLVVMGAVLWSSLHLTQMDELLRVSKTNIAHCIDVDYSLERHVKAFASLMMLEAIFRGSGEEAAFDALGESLTKVHRTLIRVISSAPSLKLHGRRTWRIISRIQECWRVDSGALPGLEPSLNYESAPKNVVLAERDIQMMLETALEDASLVVRDVFRLSMGSKEYSRSHFDAFLAFEFILCMSESPTLTKTTQLSEKAGPRALNRSLQSLLDYLFWFGGARSLGHPMWNGRLQNIRTEPTLAIALTAELVLYSPKSLLLVPQIRRRRLFRLLHDRASVGFEGWSSRRPETRQVCFGHIWEALLRNGDFLSLPDLTDDVIETLIDCLDEISTQTIQPAVNKRDTEALATSSLSILPLELFRREQREKILNSLLKICSHPKIEPDIPYEAWCGRLSIISKLMEVPNASAALATNPKLVLELAETVSRRSIVSDGVAIRILGNIVQKNLGHLLLTKDQERTKQYFSTLSQILYERLSNATTFEHSLGFLQLINTSIQVMWSHRKTMATDTSAMLKIIHEEYLRILLSDVQIRLNELEGDMVHNSALLRAAIDALVEFPDLGDMGLDNEVTATIKKSADTLYRLTTHLLQTVCDSKGEVAESSGYVLLGALKITRLDKTKMIDAASLSLAILRMSGRLAALPEGTTTGGYDLTQGDRDFIITNFRDLVKSVGLEEKISLLSYLVKEELDDFDNDGTWALLLLKTLVSSVENLDSQSSNMCKTTSGLYSNLCCRLGRAKNLRQFCLTVDIMDLIVRRKPWAITQWNMDETLGALAAVASSSGPHISSKYSGTIYLRICKNIAAILTAHRLKLKGRFHLVVPLMQNLLHCLFDRKEARELNPNSRFALPPWLLHQRGLCATPYATAYARLLSMLSDPTASSVSTTSNRHQQGLTSATAKAREIAGQHLPYILMEYIQCQLQYHLSPEVKSALTPGLYALLGAMSQETLRMVNSAMDASGRALFKVLYRDYSRYGKWDES